MYRHDAILEVGQLVGVVRINTHDIVTLRDMESLSWKWAIYGQTYGAVIDGGFMS